MDELHGHTEDEQILSLSIYGITYQEHRRLFQSFLAGYERPARYPNECDSEVSLVYFACPVCGERLQFSTFLLTLVNFTIFTDAVAEHSVAH